MQEQSIKAESGDELGNLARGKCGAWKQTGLDSGSTYNVLCLFKICARTLHIRYSLLWHILKGGTPGDLL